MVNKIFLPPLARRCKTPKHLTSLNFPSWHGIRSGYGEREWVATPDGTQTVVNHQAFAWNPSIRGAKAEDTVLLRDGKIEWLTATPELPMIEASVNGTVYPAAGVLIK